MTRKNRRWLPIAGFFVGPVRAGLATIIAAGKENETVRWQGMADCRKPATGLIE